jgi:signal transduction histidine kinase
MKLTVRVKIIASFLLILTFSCTIVFIGAMIISNQSILNEVKENQFSYANSLIELQRKTELSTQDILNVSINNMYTSRVLDEIEEHSLSQEMLEKIDRDEKVFVFNKLLAAPSTLIRLGDETVKITFRKQDTFGVFRMRVALILLSILVMTCIMLFFISGKMVRPVQKLTSATQKIADGDFDVFVEGKRNDEIGILINNFNHMVKKLNSMEYLQKDFIRNVSHEFKTPIASIHGFAKLLQSENLSGEERLEFSKIILEETERLSKLSSNILKLSKLEYQSEITEKKPFRLDEQIRSAIVLLEPKWNEKNLQLDVTMEKTICLGDEELLQQVWINLIENAIKFTDPNGTITVNIDKESDFLKVSVSDSGAGMDEETKQRIFERFFQGNTSHSTEGSGLGMSIVKRILELSGGQIEVESIQGKGSTFLVKLPAMPVK